MNTLRFPRASRDNCLRAAEPIQGPYYLNNSLLAKCGRLLIRAWRWITNRGNTL